MDSSSAPRFGYTLMTEQSSPKRLVEYAAGAEEAGFDFEVMSDHYFPWLDEMGHAGYAWSILGAAAQATERIPLMTYVTCPILRYHPAVVAQKAATMQILSGGRFRLGLGAGENLNEHVVGQGWQPANVRHERLTEAVEIIGALFGGGYVNYRGAHFDVDSAKLWDLPDEPVQIGIAKKVFSPPPEEVAFAKKVLEAIPDGRGVHMIDGKMQDDATWKQCKVMVDLAEMLSRKDPELAAAYEFEGAPA